MVLISESLVSCHLPTELGTFTEFISGENTAAFGIPVVHDSISGSGWNFISGGKRVGELHGF